MSLLTSQQAVDLCERDSGLSSPMEESVIDSCRSQSDESMLVIDSCRNQSDSDEEIAVGRKGRCRKALRDSDGEQEESGMPNALLLSESSEEEKKSETESVRKKRGKRVSRISTESDESEPEKADAQIKPKEAKKREKSQRRIEKEKRNAALVKRLKDKTEEALPMKVLNDSGCLLGDSDLFDAQMEEEEEEEESLDAIRSAVKLKHKPCPSEFSGDEEPEYKPQRTERKAARASKEALKQLHSESQRLVRESMLNLPYHMPEPKSIEQFFRRRPRPPGPAMALLRSAEYQPCAVETVATTTPSLPVDEGEPQEPCASPEQPKPAGGEAGVKHRQDKLARLRALGVDPPPVPQMCADDGAFVQLEPPREHTALKALQERFMKHVLPVPRPRRERTLQLDVVRKDSAPSGREELRSESISVTVRDGPDEPEKAKPGEKLVVLKSRLQQAMAERRRDERERRAALHRLDNEDCDEEEEAEMTDSEDEEGVEELLGNGGEEDEALDKEEREDEAPGKTCFKSASLSPADAEGTLMLFAGNSCSRTGDGVRRSGVDHKMEEDDALTLVKDSSHNSSFELMGSMIPSYQPVRATGRGLTNGVFRSPSPCLFRPSFLGSASKSSGKMSEPSLSLPVEDSQDLYAPSSPSECAVAPAGDSQGRFSLEDDTHSQLLDADGFLNVGPRGVPRRSHKRQLLLDSLDENAMDANMGELLGLCSGVFGSGQTPPGAEDELLGLCSGAFPTQQPVGKSVKPGERREESHGSSEADEDRLLALCSGRFTGSTSAASLRSASAFEEPSDTNRKNSTPEEEEEEEEGDDDFRLLSDVDSLSEKEENDKSETEEETEDEEDDEREAVFGPRPGKKKMRLAQFVESEAELSGSDAGSEDEEDDGRDEYEEEEIQEELPSDEELMDQVNKIHMKQILDDDKRKLRLYQERYLADGDLHSDGPGRARRFRWKNIDDNFEFGGTGADGGEEEEEEEIDQMELQRRKERLEREQWLREQTEAQAGKGEDAEDEEKIGDEDSRFMKLAKKLTAKTLQKKDPQAVPLQEKAAPSVHQLRKPLVKRGSLLSQPPALLQKLSCISNTNPSAPRNSRGFLFQTLSPEKEPPASQGPRKQVKKRVQTDSCIPTAKRPCLGTALNPAGLPRSVFSFLEN